MSSMLNDTIKTAKSVMETAKDGTEHAVSTTRSALMDGFKAAAGMVGTLRDLDRDHALGWVGLQRRASPLRALAIFGAGALAGAAAGVLLTPMSGAETRQALLRRLDQLEKDAREALAQLGTEATAATGKVEELAAKAGDSMKSAERKIENKVGGAVDALKEGVAHQGNAASDAAKSSLEEGRSTSGSPNRADQSSSTGRSHANHRPS